jgi:hypothetical protein
LNTKWRSTWTTSKPRSRSLKKTRKTLMTKPRSWADKLSLYRIRFNCCAVTEMTKTSKSRSWKVWTKILKTDSKTLKPRTMPCLWKSSRTLEQSVQANLVQQVPISAASRSTTASTSAMKKETSTYRRTLVQTRTLPPRNASLLQLRTLDLPWWLTTTHQDRTSAKQRASTASMWTPATTSCLSGPSKHLETNTRSQTALIISIMVSFRPQIRTQAWPLSGSILHSLKARLTQLSKRC